MKKLITLITISLFFCVNLSAQENNFKYKEIDGKTFKVFYSADEKIQLKEAVYKLETPENGKNYRSLDYYEKFNKNGNLVFKGSKINGNHLEYFDNGNKMIQGAVLNSKKEGRWAFFNQEEKIVKVEIYKAGELMNTIEY